MAKPTLIYDGECAFCSRWIERWRVRTGERVEYLTSQEAETKFPEISEAELREAVQWVGQEGERLSGAPAIFAVLAMVSASGRALQTLYRKTPPLAHSVDAVYRLVAQNRQFFSRLTRWLWGADLRVPTYAISGRLFLHVLGFTYLIAFLSYWIQFDGLNGQHGILPLQDFLQKAKEILGGDAYWQFPSVCWFGASDTAVHAWCIAGVIAAASLMFGFAPLPCLVFLWVDYLSLSVAGQIFYQFQWDILLLEAGFLAIFLSPLRLSLAKAENPPPPARFLLIWLLFRLVFASGVVKLSSGDPVWLNATALDYHYFTQPLPTPVAWFAQQLPSWWQRFSVRVMFFVELVLPFFLFAPRRPRLIAAAGIAFLQGLIALTGNYGFFNLLTLALCLLAIDDAVWTRWRRGRQSPSAPSRGSAPFLPRPLLLVVAIIIFLLSLVPLTSAFRRPLPFLSPLMVAYESIAPLRTINGYGLFAVMTKERREILIQGSADGITWKPYLFRFKPGDPHRAPPWVAPYMPRLDWQMWFAALGSVEQNPWFVNFLARLLEASPPLLRLLEKDPFAGERPQFVRALTDKYTFTTMAQRAQSGNWWNVEPVGIYCPEVSLRRR
jgi:predicted DCC family thiol-disulfide oxidoreductase YuxK